MNRVVFLDVDGVINSDDWLFTQRNSVDDTVEVYASSHMARYINPVLVQKVKSIIDNSGAVVVLSSSWRELFSVEQFKAILGDVGWPDAPLIDKTPIDNRGFRGSEINMWLKDHPEVEKYVILDDNSNFYPGQNLVLTDYRRGITDEDVKEALDFLM